MGRRELWVWVCLWLCLIGGISGAEEIEIFGGPDTKPGESWRIQAEKIVYEADRRIYIATGKVEIRQGERRLTAERVQVNEITRVAAMEGQVVLVLGEDILSGQEGYFNLASRCGEIREARLFIKRNHFHVSSPLIRKTGEQTYFAEKATVTTCDADLPAWSFSASKLSVVLEGFATARDSFLRLAGVPVLYAPVGVLPVRSNRQSGLLMPVFGQHRAGGTVVEVPLYWAINNFADATFYQNFLSRRGYMQGAELRYRGYQDAAGNFRFSYINDGHSGAPAPNRYWAAAMVNQPLGENWNLRGTLDMASDFDYLKDFNFGYLGLNRTSRELLSEMGRDLEQEEVPMRLSTGVMSGNFAFGNFTAYSRYYQKLLASDPSPYHRLPGVAFNSLMLPLGNLPLSVGVETSYTHFLQNQNPGQSGQKLDFHPQLWCQMQPLPGLYLDGRVGFRETLFRINERLPESPKGDYIDRQLFDAKVSMATMWFKDYGRGADQTWYRHTLRPEVTYWNMPRYRAHRYPDFNPFDWGWVEFTSRNLPVREGDDPLGGVNTLTYGFSSNLMQRGENLQGQALVQDLFWFRLTHGVFFNTTNMGLDGTDLNHHRFSDFLGETEVALHRRLTLGLNLGMSPYKESFNRTDVHVRLYDQNRKSFISLGYLYLKDYANQINATTYLDILRSVKTWVNFSHTFLTNKRLEKRYGLILERQCWGISLSYTERPDDKRIGVTLLLPGLEEKFTKSRLEKQERRD